MKPLVIHDIFVPGGNFHIGKLFKPSGNIPFHLAIWKALNDPTSTKSFTMEFVVPGANKYEHGDRMHALLFRTDKDMADFTKWWNIYTKRYGDDDIQKINNCYPILKEGAHINGYAYKHGLGSASDTRRGFHDWAWIVSNTTGKVTHSGEYWIFEDETEMVQMKLRGKPEFKRGFDYMDLLSGTDIESYSDLENRYKVELANEDDDMHDAYDRSRESWDDPF